MFLIMFVWWLIRYIQLSEVIRLNTCDLCILLCADYGSVIKRRLGLCINHNLLYQCFSVLVSFTTSRSLYYYKDYEAFPHHWYRRCTKVITFIHLFSIRYLGMIKSRLSLLKRNRAIRGSQWDKYWGKFKVSIDNSDVWEVNQELVTRNTFSFLSVTHSFPSSCAIFPWDSSRFFWVTCSFTSMPCCLAITLYTQQKYVLGNKKLFKSTDPDTAN